MQHPDLPKMIQPGPMAAKDQVLVGVLRHSVLERLSTMLPAPCDVEVKLTFGRDAAGIFICSELNYKPSQICQVCLHEFEQNIESATQYRPVYTIESSREIDPNDEPVLYENGFINTINMLEDEAMLALGEIPKCLDCLGDITVTSPSQFAILATSN